MPGLSVHSAKKGVSKAKAGQLRKNTIRTESAISGTLEGCTYGRIIKAVGDKRFIVLDTLRNERMARILGKMARIGPGDVVLLNERDYETRSSSDKAMYDIMALFDKKDVSRLIKSKTIPSWFSGDATDEEGDVFDYSNTDNILEIEEEEIDVDNI